MSSEDGWEPSHATPDLLEWITIPGTNPPVSLQLLKGWPLAIMRAYAADYNAFIEPLRDGDSGGFTPTNSVATSNHLNGTAMDLCWESHPFHVKGTFNAGQMVALREMLAFYEDTIFWAGDWNDPIDEMHHQMGYDTFNNPATGDFIARKIRADGYSTFRRGGTTAPPVVVPPAASSQIDVLVRATGITQAKATEVVTAVVEGLRDSQCNNVNRIAMWLAQIGEESGSFVYTEEIADGDESTDRWKYKGRTWIQITWESNYAGLSQWAFDKGLIPTPTYFVDDPKALAEVQYAGLGPAWYWTVARPQINALCDAGDIFAVTQAINGGQNGAADREARYNRALALSDQLLALATTAIPAAPGDDMAQVPQDQWDRVYREITQLLASRSPLRHLGEGSIDTLAGFVLNTDGSEHVEVVRLLAGYGHPPTIALLQEVAAADPQQYPDRQSDRLIAQAILAEATSPPATTNGSAPVPVQQPVQQPQVVYLPAVIPEPAAAAAPAVPAASTGAVIGQAYDALEALRLADALPIAGRAPLAALIAVLQTKNGSTLGSTV